MYPSDADTYIESIGIGAISSAFRFFFFAPRFGVNVLGASIAEEE